MGLVVMLSPKQDLGVLRIISVLWDSLLLFEGTEAGEWSGMTGLSWFYSRTTGMKGVSVLWWVGR